MAWRWPRTLRVTESEPERSLTVQVDGVLVRARVVGAGAPVVMVHGLGASAHCWRHNVAELARRHRLYLLDLPGFGDSDTPAAVLTPEQLADVVARWCLAIDLQHASFVGHSLGGEICMWLAAKYPTMVDRLVLAASTGARSGASLPQRLLRLFHDSFREPLHHLPVILGSYQRAGAWRILNTIHTSDPEALSRWLGRIAAPTLVIWGARDPVVTRTEAEELVAVLPNAELAIIEHGAHGLVFDAPRSFNRLVGAFLAAAPAQAWPVSASAEAQPG